MSLPQFKYKKRIEEEIILFLAKKKEEYAHLLPAMKEAIEKIEEFTLRGGKRIRATLIITGYFGCGGDKIDEIIKLSVCAELLHSALLIHDDIIDNDATRRGGPTVHASFWNKFDKKTSESLALIFGDIAYGFAFDVILKSNFTDIQKMAALRELLHSLNQTFYGEILDIVTERVDENYITHLHEFKAAYYTVVGPLRIGAVLANADEKILQQLTTFGLKAGRAFQMKDDILGAFGDEAELGKSVGSDFREGKKTLLVAKANLWDKIGRPLNNEQIEDIKKSLVDSGSLAYSNNLVKSVLAEAKMDLNVINLSYTEKQFLYELIDYLETRRS